MRALCYAIFVVSHLVFLLSCYDSFVGDATEVEGAFFLSGLLNIPLVATAYVLIRSVLEDARCYWALALPLTNIVLALYLGA